MLVPNETILYYPCIVFIDHGDWDFGSKANSVRTRFIGREVMELRHLRLIHSLSEEGTLTNAGKKLCLSQSALSHQLSEIEQECGVLLFKRARKRMVLTPAGKRVLKCATAVLDELRHLHNDMRRMASGDTGTLRIAACQHACFHWLPAVLRSFRQVHPGVQVQVVTAATYEPAAHLLKGTIDLAIENFKEREPRILYKKLFDDEMVALVHKDHHWARKTYVTAKHFADEHLINYDRPLEEVVFYQRVLLPARVTPKSLTQLSMTEAIIDMVKAGIGVAVLNRWSVLPYLGSPALRAIRVTRKGFKRVWYAAVKRGDHQPRFFATFIDLLARHGSS
jgi:LysR family transcriptional regulator for metE and metH